MSILNNHIIYINLDVEKIRNEIYEYFEDFFVVFDSRAVPAHVRWAPFHHGMARPLVAVGGDGLQL
jgi:hypothetical protein